MELSELVTVYSEKTPNPESMKFVANKMILPIPQREIDNNTGLVIQQNPGY